MLKSIRFTFFAALIGCLPALRAQVTLLDQPLLTQSSFDAFTAVNITGTQAWNFSPLYGATCSGYSGGVSNENEDWLISPAVDLSQAVDPTLTFSHTRGSASVLNVGVAEGWYKVFATSNYSGDPATTAWIELSAVNQTVPTAWQYVSSGNLVIPEAAKSAQTRIAFRYLSFSGQSATWEIKNVKIFGAAQVSADGVFKVVNWNTDWLGCETFGPSDEALQVNNVISAIQSMNADVYCLQEVANSASHPSISTIVALLGSDQWGGAIAPSTTDECDQRQGIIYRKSKVQFVSSTLLASGNPSQGNSYYYNWSGGRYPAVYNLNFVSGPDVVPVTVVNIHAKAEDGDPASYTRRLGGSESLKTILDGAAYTNRRIILTGDFNDYLIGTQSQACSCTVSPFANFMADGSGFTGISQDIVAANSGWNAHPIIENTLLSGELIGNYIPGSAMQEVAVTQNIGNYFYTTSDHYPMSFSLAFPVLGTGNGPRQNAPAVFPNPVGDVLTLTGGAMDATTADVFDLTGRKVKHAVAWGDAIDVSALPPGVYLLKTSGYCIRFVKK